jgi:hypothetical protein
MAVILMLNTSLLDIIILLIILFFLGTLDIYHLSTLQSLGVISSIGWIILLIFRLIKEGRLSSKKAGVKSKTKQRNKIIP